MHNSRRVGAALSLAGVVLTAASIVAALAAADHMAGANLCGPLTRHCTLCVAAAASLLASFGVIASGALLLREPRSGQVRARPA